ncbi:MAG: chromosome segregation protein SMC [Oscillospiraceae bacterium]|nr:chromosome segregation protein SMC [Oscillospiraceae bacterium]
MYLESLELQGFKSFPDKIKLNFDKGITAVVGPNGSGKSNIGDAVRWVLGEQSSRTLRGAKMEDVIFSGTQFRKPMGFASVTLNIINNKGILQIPSEQVSVTRKLYRSGESEYLINGSQVRLKDVCELFMDTGLGRDGYSIIGQGRVAEIVSAKSNERREIFEEAAGISKFRYKKAEAERRLAAAQDNILRLRDIIGELEGRVEPLRIQSEKAAKFLEYSDTKKSLEITVWVRQLDDLKKNSEELSDKLLISTNEYNGIEADISRLEEEAEELSLKIQQGALHIEEMRSEILESERSNTQIHADIAVCENDILHSNEAIEDIKKQQQLSQNSNTENRKAIEENLAAVKEIERNIAQTKSDYEAANADFNAAVNEQEGFNSIFSDVQSELNRLYIKQSELSVSIATGKQNAEDIEARLDNADLRNEAVRTACEELRREKTETSDGLLLIEEKTGELNNRLGGLSKLFSGRTERLSAAKKQLDDLNFAIRDKEQRIKMLSDLENSMEGFAHSVKQVLKAARTGQLSGVYGSAAQLIKVNSEYSLAIETAMGGALQNIIVENEETAKRGIRFLQETKAGRATFLPITSVKGARLGENGLESCSGFIALAVDLIEFDPKLTGIFNSLLGRIVIAENIDLATNIAKRYGYKFRIVTLDGQVINAGGSFTGGSSSKSSGVLTRKNDIEKLTAEKESLGKKLAEIKQSCEKLQAETDKLGFDIEAAKDELNTIQSDKIRFESELKRIDAMLAQNEEQLKNAVSDKEKLKERLSETNSEISSNEKALEEISAEISSKEKTVSENEEKRIRMQQKREALTERMSSLKLHEAELSKDIEAVKAEISRLEAQCLEIGDNSARLALELDAQHGIIKDKEQRISELNARLAGSKETVEEINKRINAVRSEQHLTEQSANEARAKVRELSESKEKFSREITRLEERKSSVQSAYDKIIADMSEQYNIYLSEAMQIAQPVTDLLAVQRNLSEIKQKIRALGSVNVAAIEEYKEVSERYNFMSEQLNDVESSKRELEKLIDELTENMRRQFKDSFNQINENFKSIFAELFGGGHAELTLTDPEDVLESGIEIKVAPPGKVINNLSLLSGGEQAFVAIAIYFSILKLKPAPFCILDEIEAALDDINVTKYARYLRKFTDTTQFILITHRRGSMDEADVMYGVTMQEKGTSKILRLEQPPADLNN